MEPTKPESSLLVETFEESSYPTEAQCVHACRVIEYVGHTVEGIAPSTVTTDRVIYALNIGNKVPPVGTRVIATHVGVGDKARWVFAWR